MYSSHQTVTLLLSSVTRDLVKNESEIIHDVHSTMLQHLVKVYDEYMIMIMIIRMETMTNHVFVLIFRFCVQVIICSPLKFSSFKQFSSLSDNFFSLDKKRFF